MSTTASAASSARQRQAQRSNNLALPSSSSVVANLSPLGFSLAPYVPIRQLGQGSFGRVLLVRDSRMNKRRHGSASRSNSSSTTNSAHSTARRDGDDARNGMVDASLSPSTQGLYVLKEVDLASAGKTGRKAAMKEVSILKLMAHPFIIGYKEFFERTADHTTTSSGRSGVPSARVRSGAPLSRRGAAGDGHSDRFGRKGKSMLFIIMEYADGGDLDTRIQRQRKLHKSALNSLSATATPHAMASAAASTQALGLFPEVQILQWVAQLALALRHVHEKHILHRDIKSENIFCMKDGTVKLGDFGISKALDSTLAQAKTRIGTPYYLSPEICMNKAYDSKSDVWSFGVVIYELMSLRHPFDASSMESLLKKIVRGSPSPLPKAYSKPLRSLVDSLLAKDPARRPSAAQVLALDFLKPFVMKAQEMVAAHRKRIAAEQTMMGGENKIQEAQADANPTTNEMQHMQIQVHSHTESEHTRSIRAPPLPHQMASQQQEQPQPQLQQLQQNPSQQYSHRHANAHAVQSSYTPALPRVAAAAPPAAAQSSPYQQPPQRHQSHQSYPPQAHSNSSSRSGSGNPTPNRRVTRVQHENQLQQPSPPQQHRQQQQHQQHLPSPYRRPLLPDAAAGGVGNGQHQYHPYPQQHPDQTFTIHEPQPSTLHHAPTSSYMPPNVSTQTELEIARERAKEKELQRQLAELKAIQMQQAAASRAAAGAGAGNIPRQAQSVYALAAAQHQQQQMQQHQNRRVSNRGVTRLPAPNQPVHLHPHPHQHPHQQSPSQVGYDTHHGYPISPPTHLPPPSIAVPAHAHHHPYSPPPPPVAVPVASGRVSGITAAAARDRRMRDQQRNRNQPTDTAVMTGESQPGPETGRRRRIQGSARHAQPQPRGVSQYGQLQPHGRHVVESKETHVTDRSIPRTQVHPHARAPLHHDASRGIQPVHTSHVHVSTREVVEAYADEEFDEVADTPKQMPTPTPAQQPNRRHHNHHQHQHQHQLQRTPVASRHRSSYEGARNRHADSSLAPTHVRGIQPVPLHVTQQRIRDRLADGNLI